MAIEYEINSGENIQDICFQTEEPEKGVNRQIGSKKSTQ